MQIIIELTTEQHDLILSQLRKKEDGSDDITVKKWLEEALSGKLNNCTKRKDLKDFKDWKKNAQ